MFNNLRLKYMPKRNHFTYKGMVCRGMLAVMDHNENAGRTPATAPDGKGNSINIT